MSNSPRAKINSVMMIEDNHIDQMLYRRILERSGLVGNIQSFSLADEALAHLTAHPDSMPDMILLDINMPRMDGFEFLEAAISTFGTDFSVVVVMLTTSLDPKDVERAKEYDVVKKYLDKPLTPARVQELPTLI